jgi:hypothetical protein
MREARGLRFPRKREIPFSDWGFPLSSFPLLCAGCQARTGFQESAKLAAVGFRRPLLFLGVVVMQNGTSVLDHVKDQSLDAYPSRGGVRCRSRIISPPKTQKLFTCFRNGFPGARGRSSVPGRAGSRSPFFFPGTSLGRAHPASGPLGKVFTVVVDVGHGGLL